MRRMPNRTKISVIIPVYNGGQFVEECLSSIEAQRIPGECNDTLRSHKFEIEISIYDDASTDLTPNIIDEWWKQLSPTKKYTGHNNNDGDFVFSMIISRNSTNAPKGAGYSKNRAIEQSNGQYLCFQDADDVMGENRIFRQFYMADSQLGNNAIIGCKFTRIPEGSTPYYSQWANNLTISQLYTQIYQSFGPTIIMPTWFCNRSVYERIPGGFTEVKSGIPEDLIFFYKHIDAGGKLVRVDDFLLIYRYHTTNTTFSIDKNTIWNQRLQQLESDVLDHWEFFTIWNAGKLGRRLYRSLTSGNRSKVKAFCDVDKRKLHQAWYHPHPLKAIVPICKIEDASPPFVICVKTEITFDEEGDFHKILRSVNLEEGKDYYFFN